MKRIISATLFLTLTAAAFAQSQPPDKPLFGVFVNGREGFIDAGGRMVISVPFEHVDVFREGLAIAFDGGRFGFIDTAGKVVIPLRYAMARDFSQGLAAVSVESRTWKFGYIDRTGRMVIAPQFDQAGEFNEGLALVRVGELLRYIDPSGHVAIDLHERRMQDEENFADARHFSHGLAAFNAGATAPKWGFMDKSGKPVIPPRFDAVDRFYEGLARVVLDGRHGYIDTAGNMVLEIPGDRTSGSFSQGLAAVKAGDKFGYIDTKGTMVIAPRFDDAKEFVADRARVKIGDAFGYIDKTGRLAIPAHFKDGEDFANGLARVSPSSLCSEYIDAEGRVVWRNGGTEKGMPCAESVVLKAGDPFIDPRDGQRYPTVMVGETAWLGRNLAFVAPRSWCYDDAATCDEDGRLYAWTAARDACPAGWHLPSDAEWQELETFAGLPPELVAQKFDRPTDVGTELMTGGSSGFAAPRAGSRQPNRAYAAKGEAAELWTSSETDEESAIYRMLSKGGIRRNPRGKSSALSVRCVRDGKTSAAKTPASAPAGSPLEIARNAAMEGESAEATGHVGELRLEKLNEASAALDSYRKLHPDDIDGLLLAARLGRLQEMGVQIFSAPQPEIGRQREAEQSQRAHLLELQSLVDRVLAIAPGNAEAHYVKARLFGSTTRTVYGAGPEPGVWNVDQAILSAKKAVELAPDVVAYREALASSLIVGQKFDEATAALAGVAGGRHPMSVLLQEMAQVPVPNGAIALPGPARDMADAEMSKGRLPDYPYLRVRAYALGGTGEQVEAFYRGKWPGFRFFKAPGDQDPDFSMNMFMELLRREGSRLVPLGGGRKVENASPADVQSSTAVMVLEMRNRPAAEASPWITLLPERDRKLYCVINIINYRAIK